MRAITLKYAGECRKCGATLAVGTQAIYERRVGVFCLGCEPTDPEDIRAHRQEGADRKADKYDGWAAKRRARANATLEHNERYTGDIAFNTQPGHIPLRARVIKQNDRAFESLAVADKFTEKAAGLRHVRVAGDAERKRARLREGVLKWLKVGAAVQTGLYGRGVVLKINRKTAKVSVRGNSFNINVDLSWLTRCE